MFGISPFSGAPFSSLSGVTILVALTGVQASGNVGTVDYQEQWPQTGDVAVGTVGTVGVVISVALSGVSGAGNVGSAVYTILQPITGNVGVGSVGTVGVYRELGVSGVGSVGSVASTNGGQFLTGVLASGAVGNVIAVYWKLIDDSQTANWQNITDTQTAGWALVQSDEPTTWQLIDTTP